KLGIPNATFGRPALRKRGSKYHAAAPARGAGCCIVVWVPKATGRQPGGKTMRTTGQFVLGAVVAAGTGVAATVLPDDAAAQDWQPQKPVELIIMAGTGGGADQIARLLQGLIEQKELSPRPFVPINKPGGSGAEALRYLQDKAGDDHTVLVTLNSFYT